MKKVLLVFVGAVCFSAIQAQIKIGVKGGLNLSTFSGKDAEDAKSKTGFYAGVIGQFGLGEKFSVQPEVVYSTQGAKGKMEGDPGYTFETKDEFNYINIPVLFQYKHSSGLFAQTGPQLGILLSAKEKMEGESRDVKEYIKSTDFGWAVGIGYLSKFNVGINARYNFGISKLGQQDVEGMSKVFNRVFQVGVFYLFDLKK
jgi:hypothetical protein